MMAAIKELLSSYMPAVQMAVLGDAPSMATLEDGSYGMDEVNDDEQSFV